MSEYSARYGRSTKPRWFWWVVAVIGCSLGAGWAAWVALNPAPVSAKVWGYDVIDDHTVSITLDVHRPDPQVAATCTVYAQAEDHAVVGEKEVPIPTGDDESQRITTRVETERRAVTGVLRVCQAVD